MRAASPALDEHAQCASDSPSRPASTSNCGRQSSAATAAAWPLCTAACAAVSCRVSCRFTSSAGFASRSARTAAMSPALAAKCSGAQPLWSTWSRSALASRMRNSTAACACRAIATISGDRPCRSAMSTTDASTAATSRHTSTASAAAAMCSTVSPASSVAATSTRGWPSSSRTHSSQSSSCGTGGASAAAAASGVLRARFRRTCSSAARCSAVLPAQTRSSAPPDGAPCGRRTPSPCACAQSTARTRDRLDLRTPLAVDPAPEPPLPVPVAAHPTHAASGGTLTALVAPHTAAYCCAGAHDPPPGRVGQAGRTCVVAGGDVTLGVADHEVQHRGVAEGRGEEHRRVAAAVWDVEQRRAVGATRRHDQLLRDLQPVRLELTEAHDDAQRRVLMVVLDAWVGLHSRARASLKDTAAAAHAWEAPIHTKQVLVQDCGGRSTGA